MPHIPVLLKKTIDLLEPRPGEVFADGTLGGGGHAWEIISRLSPGGKFLGLDLDGNLLEKAKSRLEKKAEENNLQAELAFINRNFAHLAEILAELGWGRLDGLLLDLGWSSDQLKGKGFSFRADEPLIMRYDDYEEGLTAKRFLNEFSEESIAKVLRKYGEEDYAKEIAGAIVARRKIKPIESTFELAEIIKQARPSLKKKIHPATKTFLAIRVFVNGELESLEKLLNSLPEIMKPNGRVAVISFHSLEDKIVRSKFKELAEKGLVNLANLQPIRPDETEVQKNPRSRSAKLRAVVFR